MNVTLANKQEFSLYVTNCNSFRKPLDICMLCGIIVPFAYTLHASTHYVTKCNNIKTVVDIIMFICYYIRVDKKTKGTRTMADLKEVNATGIEYKIQNNRLGKEIIMQLPCMRKAVDFCIYPFNRDSKYIWLQGDNKCLAINRETGLAIFSNKGSVPMDYFLKFKPTHKIQFNTQIIKDIETALGVDSRYNLEDGTLTATIC